MISVIVPVYNVELYLTKCVDNILAQSYRDLEILLIDDGSTDRSGEICEGFATNDSRVRVFHTENHGLSVARNLGLDYAGGVYVGFVDGDDWTEPDMHEVLIRSAEENHADIVECGFFLEYPDKTTEHKNTGRQVSGTDAVRARLNQQLSDRVWNKLWKKSCFDGVRFPEGRIYEDIATTYRIFSDVNCIHIENTAKYHYLQRKGSLSKIRDTKNLTDFWFSHRERYESLQSRVDEAMRQKLLYFCAIAVARTWVHYDDCQKEERHVFYETVRQMSAFAKEHFPVFGDPEWSVYLRFGVLLSRFQNTASFRIAWLFYRLYQRTHSWTQYQ